MAGFKTFSKEILGVMRPYFRLVQMFGVVKTDSAIRSKISRVSSSLIWRGLQVGCSKRCRLQNQLVSYPA